VAAWLMATERRRAPRVAERVAVTMTDAGAQLTAETKNLSASGAYCTLNQFLAPMTKLQLRFELPGGVRHRTIRCSGVVVRVEPVIATADRGHYHVAIFFTDLAPRDREAIARFVQQRLAAAPAPQ